MQDSVSTGSTSWVTEDKLAVGWVNSGRGFLLMISFDLGHHVWFSLAGFLGSASLLNPNSYLSLFLWKSSIKMIDRTRTAFYGVDYLGYCPAMASLDEDSLYLLGSPKWMMSNSVSLIETLFMMDATFFMLSVEREGSLPTVLSEHIKAASTTFTIPANFVCLEVVDMKQQLIYCYPVRIVFFEDMERFTMQIRMMKGVAFVAHQVFVNWFQTGFMKGSASLFLVVKFLGHQKFSFSLVGMFSHLQYYTNDLNSGVIVPYAKELLSASMNRTCLVFLKFFLSTFASAMLFVVKGLKGSIISFEIVLDISLVRSMSFIFWICNVDCQVFDTLSNRNVFAELFMVRQACWVWFPIFVAGCRYLNGGRIRLGYFQGALGYRDFHNVSGQARAFGLIGFNSIKDVQAIENCVDMIMKQWAGYEKLTCKLNYWRPERIVLGFQTASLSRVEVLLKTKICIVGLITGIDFSVGEGILVTASSVRNLEMSVGNTNMEFGSIPRNMEAKSVKFQGPIAFVVWKRRKLLLGTVGEPGGLTLSSQDITLAAVRGVSAISLAVGGVGRMVHAQEKACYVEAPD